MIKKLYEAAKKIQKNSYSPYSGYKVAAALLTDKNQIVAGINVENASYGGTICAERSAIVTAVGQGAKHIKSILVLTNSKTPWPPCGLCLQVMAEFMAPNTPVHLANQKGIKKTYKLKDLLPKAFKL
jgi:cytidine deaminase